MSHTCYAVGHSLDYVCLYDLPLIVPSNYLVPATTTTSVCMHKMSTNCITPTPVRDNQPFADMSVVYAPAVLCICCPNHSEIYYVRLCVPSIPPINITCICINYTITLLHYINYLMSFQFTSNPIQFITANLVCYVQIKVIRPKVHKYIDH